MITRLLTPCALGGALLFAASACEKVEDGLEGGEETRITVTVNDSGNQFFSRVHSKYENPVDIELGFDFLNGDGVRILNQSVEFKAVKPDQIAADVDGMYVDIDYACFSAYAIVTPVGDGSRAESIGVDAEGRTCD